VNSVGLIHTSTTCILIVNKIVNNNVGALINNVVDHATLGAGNIPQRRATVAGFIHDMG
jgi:hypothetical protein